MENNFMLFGERLTNFLRAFNQVNRRRIKSKYNLCYRLLEMMTNFRKFAKKIHRCSKRYPEDSSCIVWASHVYKVSWYKVVQLGLQYEFQTAGKQISYPTPLVVMELYEQEKSDVGFPEVYHFKEQLKKKGYYYMDDNDEGLWVYPYEGNLVFEQRIAYAVKKSLRPMSVVPIQLIRQYENKFFEETNCSYENLVGGGRSFFCSDFEIHDFENRYSGVNEVNIKIGDCSEMRKPEYGHNVALNTAFEVLFDKYSTGAAIITVERVGDVGPEFENVYSAMSTRYDKRWVKARYIVNMQNVRRYKFSVSHLGDPCVTGRYNVNIVAKGQIKVYQSAHILSSSRCFGLQTHSIRCSCNNKRALMPECVDDNKCIPYASELCESCDFKRVIRLISRLSEREDSRDATTICRRYVKEFTNRSAKDIVAYSQSLDLLEKYYNYLNEKYECIAFRLYKYELSLASYNISALSEMDYLNFIQLYERCFCPVEQRFMRGMTSNLSRKVVYPEKGPVILTNWSIFDYDNDNEDQMLVI